MKNTKKKSKLIRKDIHVGDLVQSVPIYNLGTRATFPSIDYVFKGVRLVVDVSKDHLMQSKIGVLDSSGILEYYYQKDLEKVNDSKRTSTKRFTSYN